jgi:hypothetical protein
MNFDAKNELTLGRQQKVQTLHIPFTIVGSATAASVSLTNDEPALLFLKTEGVDQITDALATSETATYTDSPSDANGVVNILVAVNESVTKVVGAQATSRVSGVESFQAVQLGSSTGITTGDGGGQKIMLTLDTTQALNASNTLNAYLTVHYVTAK